MNVLKPIIERFGEDIPIDPCRKKAAEDICHYFAHRNDSGARNKYYEAVEYLLRHRDSARILLYLPFEELSDAPKSFRDLYLDTWYSLLGMDDVRENFYEGDCLEVDARPDGDIPRVVKCVHLIPWLMEAGIITFGEIEYILNSNEDDFMLLRSFKDIMEYLEDIDLLSTDEIKTLEEILVYLEDEEDIDPIYNSDARLKWLEERTKKPSDLSTPNAHLEGPFSPNLACLSEKVEEVRKSLKPNEVALIGGSQIKGYGTVDSDFDVWKLDELETHPYLYPGSPEGIHVYFNTVWVGGEDVVDLAGIAKEKMDIYRKVGNRRLLLEKLESDLLQYRLLHKGFSRFTGRFCFATSSYQDMDGDCPFYNDEYRRIATMLYAKYVLIP